MLVVGGHNVMKNAYIFGIIDFSPSWRYGSIYGCLN